MIVDVVCISATRVQRTKHVSNPDLGPFRDDCTAVSTRRNRGVVTHLAVFAYVAEFLAVRWLGSCCVCGGV